MKKTALFLILLSLQLMNWNCSSSFSSVRPLQTGDLAVGLSVTYQFDKSPASGTGRMTSGFWWGYGLGDNFDLFVTPDLIFTAINVVISPLTGQLPYGARSLFSLELLPPFILRKSFLKNDGASAIGLATFSGYSSGRLDYKNIGLFAEFNHFEQPWNYDARLFAGYHTSFRSSRYNNGFNASFQINASHDGRIDKDIQFYSIGYNIDYWLYQFGEKKGFGLNKHFLILQAENIGDQNENL